MSWVETQVPCMLYCGPDLCTCSAFYFYEALEEDEEEDWSILDKKERAEKRAYETYLSRLQDWRSRGYPEVVVGESRAIYMSQDSATVSALR